MSRCFTFLMRQIPSGRKVQAHLASSIAFTKLYHILLSNDLIPESATLYSILKHERNDIRFFTSGDDDYCFVLGVTYRYEDDKAYGSDMTIYTLIDDHL